MATTPDLTDTIQSTATTLIAFEFSDSPPGVIHAPPDRPAEKKALAADLRQRIERIADDDLSDLEATLTCQAQLLNQIFTTSARNYAAHPVPAYSNTAIKAQTSYRKTIETLNALKITNLTRIKFWNSPNELNRREPNPYAALDNRTTPKTTGADAWLAVMEQEFRAQNR